MSNDRNAFAEKLKRLMGKPELLLQMCMEEHDARVRAEQKAHELERQCEAQAALYRDLKSKNTSLEKEAAFSRKAISDYEAKLAAVTETGADFLKRYEAAAGENDLLKQANKELTERFADAVETGRKTQEELEEAQAENRSLHERVKALQEQITLGNRDRFGSGSEKTEAVFGRTQAEADPLDEQAADPDAGADETDENRTEEGNGKPGDYSAGGVLKRLRQKKEGRRKAEGSADRKKPARRKGKREEDLSRMDQVNFYNCDFRKLDEQYGKGKYRIVRFNRTREIRETRPHNYVYNEYTPVIVAVGGDETKKIVSLPGKPALYPGSLASESLVAAVLDKRFDMSLPLYRLERDYESRGVPLSRQTMSNWVIHFALDVFALVRDRMWEELDQGAVVRQCDETTWRVVIWPEEEGKEKKPNGSKGYIWVHTTGEFTRGNKVILYAFEKSRGADHLRRTLKEMAGYLISDAYSGYHAIEKESRGRIISGMCWMHCRRMFARAVVVMEPGLDELTEAELLKAPEVQGLLMANEIFEADTPLKSLSSEERLRVRKEKVALLVDRFFGFIHGIDDTQLEHSPRLKEAVTYATNQETNLKVFLENGDVPIDNGYVERSIKPVALSRRNSLFSYSMIGAECNAIMYSIVETARANGADVYTYLKYLLHEVPRHLDGKDRSFLDDMMPWSEKYLVYERHERECHADEHMPESMEPPVMITTGREPGEDVA